MTTLTTHSINARRTEIQAELSSIQIAYDAAALELAEGRTGGDLEALERRRRTLAAEHDGLAAAQRGASRRDTQEVQEARRVELRAELGRIEQLRACLSSRMNEMEAALVALQVSRDAVLGVSAALVRQLTRIDPAHKVGGYTPSVGEFSPSAIDMLIGHVLHELGLHQVSIQSGWQDRHTLFATRKKAQDRVVGDVARRVEMALADDEAA